MGLDISRRTITFNCVDDMYRGMPGKSIGIMRCGNSAPPFPELRTRWGFTMAWAYSADHYRSLLNNGYKADSIMVGVDPSHLSNLTGYLSNFPDGTRYAIDEAFSTNLSWWGGSSSVALYWFK